MKQIKIITVLIIFLSTAGCATFFNSEHELFQVHDIYYQSWVIKNLEKGTDVVIDFRNLDEAVEFTSLVFRGIEVDVSVQPAGKKTIVKGVINTGPSIIENYEYKVSGYEDMIKYRYLGKEFAYPLKNVKRESTRFIE
ncbi:MAG TPA: hypothetical protein DEQ09_11940 [Bacteroidales bacterium]|nr:hypothetical protein [Bacteroidales bacterium]